MTRQGTLETYETDRLRVLAQPPESGLRSPRSARFSREEILARIKDWDEEHGAPPMLIDWDASRARRAGKLWRVERFQAGSWPSARMVTKHFATFNSAVEAAGFTPQRRAGRVKPRLSSSDAILSALREWVRRYGEPPAMTDWDPARARRAGQEWRIVRYQSGDWPSLQTVRNHFGSLSGAVQAAGLHPRLPGEHAGIAGATRAANRRVLAEMAARDAEGALPSHLTAALRGLASARAAGDDEALHASLIDIAGAALAWAGRLSDPPEQAERHDLASSRVDP